MKQAGHTLRHPGSAAAETAGRIMGRDNYQHPYTPFNAAAADTAGPSAAAAGRGGHLPPTHPAARSHSAPVPAPLRSVVISTELTQLPPDGGAHGKPE